MNNTEVVNTTSKYIVKTTGIGSETNEILVDANKLTGGTNQSTVSLIECYFLIEGTGKLLIEVDTPATDGGFKKLTLTAKGKYGLRPEQLKFGNDKIFKLTTDANVKSYLLVTEFRRN
jgi:hypothetical protein